MKRAIHQILPTLAYGDAIGNQVLELQRLFRAWEYESEIFAERWHPRLAGVCHHYETYHAYSNPENILVFHYSIGGEVVEYVQRLPDQVVLYYHNITPAHFFYRVNGELARLLAQARQQLAELAERFPAIAASPYNAQELEEYGFSVVGVAPYTLAFDALDRGDRTSQAEQIRHTFRDPSTTWLFVGRLAPNKCIHDIIKAFSVYHNWINPSSRLLLVGTKEGLELYVKELYALVTSLRLDGAVIFPGHYGPDEGLATFYQIADVYISMSEHEGFCIPLVEAMHYDVPVVAYASTGVPFTMGNAGILLRKKVPYVIAELVHEIVTNEDFRQRIVAGQRRRLKSFAPEQARARVRACFEQLLMSEPAVP